MQSTSRSWLALGILLIIMYIMCLAQVRSEYLPESSPLYDLGFEFIPFLDGLTWQSQTFWQTIADVWLITMVAIYVVLLLFFKDIWIEDTHLIKSRHSMCLAFVYVLRTVLLLCNRYPRSVVGAKNGPFLDGHDLITDALLVLLGVRTTVSDYMFSGHTAQWIMMCMTVSHYSRHLWLSGLWWGFSVSGIFFLLAVRTHYTSDVLIGGIIAALVFSLYHAIQDPKNTYIVKIIKQWEKYYFFLFINPQSKHS